MARLTGRLRSDEGTTLVELLVTMVVVGVLMAAVTFTVVGISAQMRSVKARDYATEQAQVTIERASRILRAATPVGAGNVYITYAGDNHITLYSDLAQTNGPSLVDLNVTGSATAGTLSETLTPADAGSNYTFTGPSTTEGDGFDLNTSTTALFTYYDASGNVLATPMTTAAQTTKIAKVRVTAVDQEPGSSSPITDSALIYLRNVEYA